LAEGVLTEVIFHFGKAEGEMLFVSVDDNVIAAAAQLPGE
jgi:hypothetical protein